VAFGVVRHKYRHMAEAAIELVKWARLADSNVTARQPHTRRPSNTARQFSIRQTTSGSLDFLFVPEGRVLVARVFSLSSEPRWDRKHS
jgi:hypothetical protein